MRIGTMGNAGGNGPVEQIQPTKVLLMPDGDVDYFNNDWLELVSLA